MNLEILSNFRGMKAVENRLSFFVFARYIVYSDILHVLHRCKLKKK